MVRLAAALGVLFATAVAAQARSENPRSRPTNDGQLLRVLPVAGLGYDSAAGNLATTWGVPITITAATPAPCPDSDGTLRTLAANKPCVVDGASLRVRGAVTNLALRSAEIETASWTLLNATVSANQAVAPDGTTSADKILETTANAQHGVYQSIAVTANTIYTQSAYVKQGGRTWAWMTEGNTLTATAYFNLETCAVGTVSGTGTPSASAEVASDGFCRIALKFTTGGTQTSANFQIRTATGDGGATFIGDPTLGVFTYGAQQVASSLPGDYCPTAGTSATCSAETATVPTPAGLSRTEGCALACVTPSWTGSSGATAYALVSNSTSTVRFLYFDPASTGFARAYDGTNLPSVASGFVSGVRACFLTQWSAAGNYLKVTNLTSGASNSTAFTTFPAFDATTWIGSNGVGTSQLNGSADGIKFGSSPEACR